MQGDQSTFTLQVDSTKHYIEEQVSELYCQLDIVELFFYHKKTSFANKLRSELSFDDPYNKVSLMFYVGSSKFWL